ncbi:Mur ligase family, catalytic domain protein [Acididesulfobacillus acetoxydans]|uniref:UDP-N-acetylmuramoyl-L-alanyl-D-glutamate--2,6-diaminopimelate ligase n=1 Tax=Acididesulfobacillus acetoxydans TaxID=1561005 RepID=A0A8S0VYC2_9FIRM|nr:UDP-N-acetylmuramoyl-L-alanyl-D-glutamate--2,6-diaminopimelate ligase [Acididesulfobacillus acetoxydans]CAA7602893.1 Mur ligase family, catalytic domain protein [Acididesulfobacillus acetoxydans]CEJ05774.1 UDP-N-acetylmuramoyl-L-alanyl-D-glutamate--2,6-diaminopimelate ligase [Acididesulfobacillus acetoxydans]
MAAAKTLAQVVAGLDETVPAGIINTSGDLNTPVEGITVDSRGVKTGDLFVCVPGFAADGHDFAAQAVAAGAPALVVERFLPLPVPQVRVRNARRALGFLAASVYDHPSLGLEVVGVTGTNGKTTVTHLVERIAARHGHKVGLIGTLGARIAGRRIPGQRTTPEATEIQKLLAAMRAEGVSLAVMEVSSHALDLGRVNGCEFDAGIFTNLTQDHLDYHKTMEEYLEAKAKLFRGLQGKKEPKIAIINADDPAADRLRQASAAAVVTYGLGEAVDYRAAEVRPGVDRVSFRAEFRGRRQEVVYATPGLFSVYNALAAFAWAVERGYDPEEAAEALAGISGVPGRFESIRQAQPFQVIVDYAHTPDGLANVLKTAREFTPGRLITVFGCGGDRDRGKRPLMGGLATQYSDFTLVTSDNPRTEDPEEIIKEILKGVRGSCESVVDRREAIRRACGMAGPGDTILIAGKGHETYQIIGSETHPFDDREVAREVLAGLGYGGSGHVAR